MAKYITSDQVCEMFGITKVSLWRWEKNTQWGMPFPAPAFPSVGGAPKRYLLSDVRNWEKHCIGKKAVA
ncbi:hypothetical protein MN869_15425 [Acinetobacter sp. NIPH1876]|uniref:DNA-binding protein n=2 Tax=Acinetobacter higginsii TaxID=70347 RepID=N9SWM5_9GAMM|nr:MULTISPECIES: hypothetical protein [Acinetobacter]ENX55732.1 hypothetical protein F902_03291 [Acinetobacter higginsii]MCJ0829835.1 hypothetical protein [Acinetobacter sp. NIPH1876]WEI17365.1 hypothetical protein PY247_12780 [Acinetobacter proteolyticus]